VSQVGRQDQVVGEGAGAGEAGLLVAGPAEVGVAGPAAPTGEAGAEAFAYDGGTEELRGHARAHGLDDA